MLPMPTQHIRPLIGYVDNAGTLCLEECGTRVEEKEPYRAIGDVRIGAHTVSLNTHFCTCMSYKFRNNRSRDRNCKHILALRPPATSVVYRSISYTTPCHLIAQRRSKNFIPSKAWAISRKYDGIRVLVRGTLGYTRGSTKSCMEIDLSPIWQAVDTDKVLDAELCALDPSRGGHDYVLAKVLSNKLDTLCVRVFDLVDNTAKRTFEERLEELYNLRIPHTVQYAQCNEQSVHVIERRLQEPDLEGFVLRHRSGMYTIGSRNTRNSFKWKHETSTLETLVSTLRIDEEKEEEASEEAYLLPASAVWTL